MGLSIDVEGTALVCQDFVLSGEKMELLQGGPSGENKIETRDITFRRSSNGPLRPLHPLSQRLVGRRCRLADTVSG